MQVPPSQPIISHIKAQIDLKGLDSCILQLAKSLREKPKVKKYNFYVVKERYTYMIFEKRGFINIANIKSWEDLANVLPSFEKSFSIKTVKLASSMLKVDNITASGVFPARINLVGLNDHFSKAPPSAQFPKAIYQYSRNRFPAAFIKTRQCGTVILHATGRYCIVGAKDLADLENIYTWIHALIFER